MYLVGQFNKQIVVLEERNIYGKDLLVCHNDLTKIINKLPLNNNENVIYATITNYNPEAPTKFVTTNFEYNTIGLGPRAMSIDDSRKNYVTKYTSCTVKTPNNDVKCVDNKAYGYTLLFGIEK